LSASPWRYVIDVAKVRSPVSSLNVQLLYY